MSESPEEEEILQSRETESKTKIQRPNLELRTLISPLPGPHQNQIGIVGPVEGWWQAPSLPNDGRASSLALFGAGPPHTPTDHGAACDWGSGTALCRRPTLTAQLLKLPGGTRHGLGSQTTITRGVFVGQGYRCGFPGDGGGGHYAHAHGRPIVFPPHTHHHHRC